MTARPFFSILEMQSTIVATAVIVSTGATAIAIAVAVPIITVTAVVTLAGRRCGVRLAGLSRIVRSRIRMRFRRLLGALWIVLRSISILTRSGMRRLIAINTRRTRHGLILTPLIIGRRHLAFAPV